MSESALTPLQLRAARKLLCWSRERLSARMGTSRVSIGRFENTGEFFKAFIAQQAREILEAAGIEFLPENGDSPGVRLK